MSTIIDVPDEVQSIVMNSIAKVAKGFDNMIDANGYGNLAADDKTVFEWKNASDLLWPAKDSTMRIVVK